MRTLLVFYVTLTCISFSYGQQIPERPNPPRLVNDFAELLSAAEEQQLENKLKQYDDSTSTQIAIVTVKTLEGNDIAAYSFELGERWGIGQQGMDNGMLILVAPEEREIWIATGYGLEAFVPDAIAKRIVEKTIKPNFRNEDYYKGLDQATNIIMSLLSGEFAPDQIEEEVSIWPLLLLLGGFILVMYFISRGNKGGGGTYYDPDSRTYMGPYRGTSTWSDFSGGRGSFGGGSGSSGGGFGGFGGGGFGGGGAGGSW